jgi:hypothetical protein
MYVVREDVALETTAVVLVCVQTARTPAVAGVCRLLLYRHYHTAAVGRAVGFFNIYGYTLEGNRSRVVRISLMDRASNLRHLTFTDRNKIILVTPSAEIQ